MNMGDKIALLVFLTGAALAYEFSSPLVFAACSALSFIIEVCASAHAIERKYPVREQESSKEL